MTYRIGEPYSFLGPGFFGIFPNMQRFDDLSRWVKISSGEIEVPFMIQWANTPNPRFALTSIVEWGLGPLAGLASFAGLAVAALELVRWRQHSRNVLLVVWAAINLGYFGFQFAKFMRYFLPVYPALAVLAAYLLLRVLPRLRRAVQALADARGAGGDGDGARGGRCCSPWRSSRSTAGRTPGSRPRSGSSQNVPASSTLGVEHWDDALPLRLPATTRSYTDVSLNLYDEESPEKVRKLDAGARQGRLPHPGEQPAVRLDPAAAAPIPDRDRVLPRAVRRAARLREGRAVRLAPGAVRDHARFVRAQEDFTVYDHPTVMIFKKTPQYSTRGVERLLASVPLDQIERTKPVDASARKGLMLTPDEWLAVLTHGTWSEYFTLDGVTTTLAVPLWLLAVEALGLAAFPLCWLLMPGLADRGYGVAKILGLALVSYVAWLAASVGLAPFGRGLVYTSLLLLIVASSLVVRRQWPRLRADLRADLRRAWSPSR